MLKVTTSGNAGNAARKFVAGASGWIERGLVAACIVIEDHVLKEIKAKHIVDTGRLRGSITYATSTKRSYPKGEAKGSDAVSAPTFKGIGHVGTNVEYAEYVEYGHRTRGGGRVAPRSYMRAGLDKGKRKAIAAYNKFGPQGGLRGSK